MRNATLCYIVKDNNVLMLHRTKKQNDINEGKWIGVGGGFEEQESAEECLVREVIEETGLKLNSWKFRGIICFTSTKHQTEQIFLYTSDDFQGELIECNEGELKWIPIDKIKDLNLWEGDKKFLDLLWKDTPFFSMKLSYDINNNLTDCKTRFYS